MLLFVVRHAESTNNELRKRVLAENADQDKAQKIYDAAKSNDPGITERGHEQSAKLANWLPAYVKDLPISPGYRMPTRVISSAMARARGTADHVASGLKACSNLDLQPHVDIQVDIHEENGCWSGTTGSECGSTVAEIEAQVLKCGTVFKNSLDAPIPAQGWWCKHDSNEPRPKETKAECIARAQAVAKRLHAQAQEASQPSMVVMVTHGNWMVMLLQALLGMSSEGKWFTIDNTAVCAMVLPKQAGKPVQVCFINKAEHLDCLPAERPLVRTRSGVSWYGFQGFDVPGTE